MTPTLFILTFAASIVILVVSMMLTSSALGGVEFGQVHVVIFKGAVLLLAVNGIGLLPYGVWLSLPVWWLGLMVLFHIDFWEARTLVVINWVLNGITFLLLRLALGGQALGERY
jgi:hypothetical protein